MTKPLVPTSRLTDVVIEDHHYPDPTTGLPQSGSLTVYADPGMLKVIGKVKGVTDVFRDDSDVRYSVFLDPRYDRKWVKAEIEAAIRCAE